MGDRKKCVDGLWNGLFTVILETHQSPTPPEQWPWYTTYAMRLYIRFQNIIENAGYDQDSMVAPKAMWMDTDALNEWYNERRELRQR